MSAARQVMSSAYMNWAKTRSTAKFNLATSGLGNLKLRELSVSLDDLEITNGGYGYQPLIELIAARYRVDREAVVTAAGTTFANHLAMAALIEPCRDLVRTPDIRADAGGGVVPGREGQTLRAPLRAWFSNRAGRACVAGQCEDAFDRAHESS